MGKKLSAWKTKGMNRDLSVSAFNPEFAFENMNLRLATNENNTVLSWVNEKGPAYVSVHITKPEEESDLTGNCIGTAVLNNYLVIFTAGNYQSSGSPDRIYRLNYEVDENGNKYFEGVRLFRGNLGFSVEHPLETLVSYESEHIQKVYWTDGINQPRLINIAPEYNASGEEVIPSYTSTSFDFVPTLQLDETVSVKKVTGGGGMFAPGVIQYSFTYYNKHGQESNIFYTTPLYYISYADRGASPEDKVDNTFKIIVNNLDYNFDYLRIYSIQRSSVNGTPICKRIQDVDIKAIESALLAEYAKIDKDEEKTPEEKVAAKAVAKKKLDKISYTDTGMNGDSIDPTELLYKGGSGVHVGTMDQKDNTLFMGDLTVLNTAPPKLTDAEKAELLRSLSDEVRTFYVDIESSDNYVYGNQLTAMNSDNDSTSVSVPCAGLKHDDWYRLGVQFQDEFGRWTDPIFLKDVQVGNVPSSLVVESSGGGGGGDDHGDTDLPLMIAFENKATDRTTGIPQWITIDGTVGMVVKNPESGANETVSVNLGSTDKIQISGGNYVYFPNAFVANGSKYKGWYLADEDQNCIVKDGEGNITHEIKPLDTSLELSRDNEILITCKSTTHPDVDPTPKPEPDPEPPVWVEDFEDLVKEFNKVLNTPVTENSSTWNYLLAAYNMAKDEWDNDSIGLFNIVRDSSVEIYKYRGTDVTYAQQAQESMYSWLMAMCLSELVPSDSDSEDGEDKGKTNNQTKLYQKAYDLGGGRSIPLYGDFDAKGDVMLARLVAAGIYAVNRSNYSFSDMDSMRREIGGSTFDISNWNKGTMGYKGVSNIGYNIAANEIFPSAPGPFVDAYSSKTPPSEQPSDLFYGRSGNLHVWYNNNYKVDVAIDEWVTEHYNLEAVDDYLERTVQAVADDSESTKHQLAEKVYYAYDTGGKTKVSEKYVPNPRFTFKPAVEDSSSTKFFKGTFNSEVTGVDLSDKLTDSTGNETILKTFMDGVRNTGSNGRQQLYDAQIGRRRPATGSAVNLSRISQEEDKSNEYRKNWLDDSSISRLVGSGTKYDSQGGAHSWYIDRNGNGKWDDTSDTDPYEPYVNEPWTYSGGDNLYPDPVTYTYPSGHSAGVFGQAVMLTQILPDRAYEIFKAAYKFSVSRTIVRAHWNSDVMYGRVIGTMMIPVLNAVQSFQSVYKDAYSVVTGGGGGGTDDEILARVYLACYEAQGGTLPSASERVNHHPTSDNPGLIIFKIVNKSASNRYLCNGVFRVNTEDGTAYMAHFREPSNTTNGAHLYYWDETNFVLEPGETITSEVPIKRTYLGEIQQLDYSKKFKVDEGTNGYVLYHSAFSSTEGDYLLHNKPYFSIKSSSLRVYPSMADYNAKTNEITGSERGKISLGRVYEVALTEANNYMLPVGKDKSAYRMYAAHDSTTSVERILDPLRLVEWKDYDPPTPPTPPTPTGDASYAEYTGGNGIKYVLHNNSGIEARFTGGVTLNLSKNPDDWENSTQAYAHMFGPNASYKTNDIIIPPGGVYTSPEITTITGIYTPEVDFTDGTWYLMNTMKQPAGHPVYLYTMEFSRTRQYSSSSNHMYAATPTVNTKLQKGYTYHLNVNWVNDRAMLANASLTKDDFNKNYKSYGYAILAEGKTKLVGE